jgi:hypothetical protein
MSMNNEKANHYYALLPTVNPQISTVQGEAMQPPQAPATSGWAKLYKNPLNALEYVGLLVNSFILIIIELYTLLLMPFFYLWAIYEGYRYATGPDITYVLFIYSIRHST